MPDPVGLAIAGVTAGGVAAIIAWILGRLAGGRGSSACAVVGVVCGFIIGCRLLGVSPHWPPREDQDRLLLVLLPLASLLEILASVFQRARFAKLFLTARIVVAASLVPVLLYGSSYLSESAGPGSREWTFAQSAVILTSLSVALILQWALLVQLAKRSAPGRGVATALGVLSAGAGLAVMLSGYASGGQIGIPLSGAMFGAVFASLLTPGYRDSTGLVSVGVIGSAAILGIGRFFGELSSGYGVALFVSPQICWLPFILGFVVRCGPKTRSTLQAALPAVLIGIVIALARAKFMEKSTGDASSTSDPASDYSAFGK